MIRATELRIGNWINDISGNPTQVRGVGTNGIWISKSGPATETAFKPTPLTEEWMVKFGFLSVQIDHPAPNHLAFELNGLHVKIYHTGEIAIWYNGHALIPHIHKYVHQLQNLYFALTGNELELK